MEHEVAEQTLTEEEFAELVERLADDPGGSGELAALLQESHPAYDQRGTAATVRMRGWVLLALGRHGLPDGALIYVLEELDTGRDPYLVGAAARALRSRPHPDPAFAIYLTRAITNIRPHDDVLSFASYGAYADDETGITALAEVFATLRWMGAAARSALGELEQLLDEHRQRALPPTLFAEVTSAIDAIQTTPSDDSDCCALPWGLGSRLQGRSSRRAASAIELAMFEDHDGERVSFGEFFRGKPSAVVFFYTRCDNPRKCSLSIAKLAQLQRLLVERGIDRKVRAAAITYDPSWDLPDRLRGYARGRGVQLDADNRMLRSDANALSDIRAHFGLGVNFIESLVNRHRVELFVLDAWGRVAATFERLQWEPAEVADRLATVLAEEVSERAPSALAVSKSLRRRPSILSVFAPISALVTALFPKCPVCWAAYLSVFGIAGLERVAYSPFLLPALFVVMAINLASLWWRGRTSGRMLAFGVGAGGAFAIVVPGMLLDLGWARTVGVLLTICASVISVVQRENFAPFPSRKASAAHR